MESLQESKKNETSEFQDEFSSKETEKLFQRLKSSMEKEAKAAPGQSTRRGFLQAIVATSISVGILAKTTLADNGECGATDTIPCSSGNTCDENTCSGDNSCEENECELHNVCEASNSCTNNACHDTNECSNGNICYEPHACSDNNFCDTHNTCEGLNWCSSNGCDFNICLDSNECQSFNICNTNNTCDPTAAHTPPTDPSPLQNNKINKQFEIF